jgi:hypothetical protein
MSENLPETNRRTSSNLGVSANLSGLTTIQGAPHQRAWDKILL